MGRMDSEWKACSAWYTCETLPLNSVVCLPSSPEPQHSIMPSIVAPDDPDKELTAGRSSSSPPLSPGSVANPSESSFVTGATADAPGYQSVMDDLSFGGGTSVPQPPHFAEYLANLSSHEDSDENTEILQNATSANNPGQKKKNKQGFVFGSRYNMQNTPYTNPDDYEKKYPPDEPFKCLDSNARVWKVYLDEAKMMDDDMVEAWRDTIDLLLIFAGLFSAVVTTLVVQSSQSLQPDYSQISAVLLTELVSIQRAMAEGASITTVPESAQNFGFQSGYSINGCPG
ncbi:hypothetical protein EVG20_g2923 [Dentipellis fragilis]|uniref:DUF6535 domain-containing protein n=1 Tax=Dentipellis fragilis TaxID=205917 RepID=A0A4Y9Z7E7_9AGAM|nr:hypothetical protein EVG20_g2923 [Dentipellis fragilis]